MRSTTTLFVLTLLSVGYITSANAQVQTPKNTETPAYGTSEFRLGPDDVIEVSVYQEKELTGIIIPVRPDGKISVPLIGEMPASGKTATELQKEIAAKYARFIAEPAVTVMVKEVNSPKVSVMGEVKQPGLIKIKDRATIFDAIASAGGLTEYAKKDKIRVIRLDDAGQQHIHKVNLEQYLKGKRLDPFYVLPYDKIYVE